jgi:hypothetical protein
LYVRRIAGAVCLGFLRPDLPVAGHRSTTAEPSFRAHPG